TRAVGQLRLQDVALRSVWAQPDPGPAEYPQDTGGYEVSKPPPDNHAPDTIPQVGKRDGDDGKSDFARNGSQAKQAKLELTRQQRAGNNPQSTNGDVECHPAKDGYEFLPTTQESGERLRKQDDDDGHQETGG